MKIISPISVLILGLTGVGFLLCGCQSSSPTGPASTALKLDTTKDANGKIQTIFSVRDTVLEGPSYVFYSDGSLASVHHYHLGILAGWSFSWYENRAKSEETFQQGGKEVCYTDWDDTGGVIDQVACQAALRQDPTYADWQALINH